MTGLVPYLHVADVQRSIDFYSQMGLGLDSRFGPEGSPFWARLKGQNCDLMLALASAPIDPTVQAALCYLYTSDVAAMRAHLVACGASDLGKFPPMAGDSPRSPTGQVFDITRPHHMPCGELRVHDPDGYVLLIGQLEPL